MESYERLKIMRSRIGITQAELASSINLAQSTVGQIEKGARNLTERVASDICRVHGISKDWLLYGLGEMKIKTPSSAMEQLRQEFNLDNFTYNLVYEYLKLDEEQRKTIRDFVYKVVKLEDGADYISEIVKNESTAPAAPLPTVEEAEADYIKNVLGSAQSTDSAISSSTEDAKKVSGE